MAENLPQNIIEVYQERPRVALLMSDEGSKARSILEDEEVRDLYDVAMLVSDNENSGAKQLGEEFDLKTLLRPVGKFSDPKRPENFENLAKELRRPLELGQRGVEGVIYAGFLKIATKDFCEEFPGISCHPADLTISGEDGAPKYAGWRGFADMRQELGEVRSTIHVVSEVLDNGFMFSLTDTAHPNPELSDKEAQRFLTSKEYIVYPQTLRLLGRGAVMLDELKQGPMIAERVQEKLADVHPYGDPEEVAA